MSVLIAVASVLSISPKAEIMEPTTSETKAPATVKASTTTEPTTRAECEEYDFICSVVMSECGHEPYNGIVAVAQCLKNAMKRDDLTAYEAVKRYGYTRNRKTPNNAVRRAVADVFCHGKGVTDEPILYFYNPKLCTSAFHESQDFVIEIGNHKFFKRKGR